MNDKYLSLIKKSKSFEVIKRDYLRDTLSHSYMIICPDSDYLAEFMQAVKALFVCRDENLPCGKCVGCGRVFENIHPDVVSFPEKGKKISVTHIDEITKTASVKPIENNRKAYFLFDFQDANVQAQNKLLKVLEEPPKNVHIFLGVSGVGTVLSTITSRVKTIELEKISNEEIYQYILSKFGDSQKAEIATVCCSGEIGLAEKMASSDEFSSIVESVFSVLQNLKSYKDVMECGENLLKFKTELKQIFSVILLVFEDVLKFHSNVETGFSKSRKDEVEKIAENFNLESVLKIIGLVDDYNARLKVNCNPTILVDNFLINILEVKHKCQVL